MSGLLASPCSNFSSFQEVLMTGRITHPSSYRHALIVYVDDTGSISGNYGLSYQLQWVCRY